jgi:hypothetical protein
VKPRIAEVREIVKILDSEHDDVQALSEAVLVKAYDLLLAREQYVLLMRDDRLGVFVFGLFDTKNRATKAIGTSVAAPGPNPPQWLVSKVKKVDDV